ncbi:hypothetical protein ANO11243_089730 [Dothideomycetidae sp. 11243]|nr:hypothetical protein ANO11243_089730 [fungal sp. No.11243]
MSFEHTHIDGHRRRHQSWLDSGFETGLESEFELPIGYGSDVHDFAKPSTWSGDFDPHDSHCLSRYTCLENVALTQSPQQTKASPAFNEWAGHFPTAQPPSTSASSLSSFDEHAFSDLYTPSFTSPSFTSPSFTSQSFISPSFTSPHPNLCHSSSPNVVQHESIAQSIELGPFTADMLREGSHGLEHDSSADQLGALDQFGLSTFLPHSAFGTPLEHATPEALDSYFSYGKMSPPPLCQDERQPSLSSEYELAAELSTPSRQRGRPRRHSRSISTMSINSKITKRPSFANMRRISAPIHRMSPSCSPARQMRATPTNSNFPCPFAPYGCTSSFGSKNEWKRHVSTQHLRLDLWRCDECGDRETRPNDFNRKDLFIQHLRRMHYKANGNDNGNHSSGGSARARSTSVGDEVDPALAAAEQRCHIKLRQPPQHSCCLFCPLEFDGPGSWDERMEHVGRHLEHIKKQGRDAPAMHEWRHDAAFQHWLENEGLIVCIDGEWRLADGRR